MSDLDAETQARAGAMTLAFADVTMERYRQEHLWSDRTCASPEMDPLLKLAILNEEYVEVIHEVLAKKPDEGCLYEELTHLAAVTVAWMEGLGPRCEARGAGTRCTLKRGHYGNHSSHRGAITWNPPVSVGEMS